MDEHVRGEEGARQTPARFHGGLEDAEGIQQAMRPGIDPAVVPHIVDELRCPRQRLVDDWARLDASIGHQDPQRLQECSASSSENCALDRRVAGRLGDEGASCDSEAGGPTRDETSIESHLNGASEPLEHEQPVLALARRSSTDADLEERTAQPGESFLGAPACGVVFSPLEFRLGESEALADRRSRSMPTEDRECPACDEYLPSAPKIGQACLLWTLAGLLPEWASSAERCEVLEDACLLQADGRSRDDGDLFQGAPGEVRCEDGAC